MADKVIVPVAADDPVGTKRTYKGKLTEAAPVIVAVLAKPEPVVVETSKLADAVTLILLPTKKRPETFTSFSADAVPVVVEKLAT